MKNQIEFKVSGKFALFTDPITKIGGEKCSYHIPTYEALKGIVKSIYWKPTLIWVIDKVRVINPVRTQSKSVKPLKYGGGNELSIYTYLVDVEYQVQAHFEWNEFRPDMEKDRIEGKHFSIATRMIEKGGRQDVFLGTRECQGYVEPCSYGEGAGFYDGVDEIGYGLMFYGFDYPDEIGESKLYSRFWHPKMQKGVVEFPRPTTTDTVRKFVRDMIPNPPKSEGLLEGGLLDELD
jgi:CRISPR-associated protein Cas5d